MAEAAGLLAGLALLGYWPTLRWGGQPAIPAMLAGSGVGLAASAVGALPMLKARHRDPRETLSSVIGSISLRFATAIALGSAVVLSGWFAVKPLLLWVAISYVALLATDVRFARACLAGSRSGFAA